MTDLAEYDFALPPELIAQEPPATRGASRMLILDRASGDAVVEQAHDEADREQRRQHAGRESPGDGTRNTAGEQ